MRKNYKDKKYLCVLNKPHFKARPNHNWILFLFYLGFRLEFIMKKKEYIKPDFKVLSLYSDEIMEGGFHVQSNINGGLTPGDDERDPEEDNPTGY